MNSSDSKQMRTVTRLERADEAAQPAPPFRAIEEEAEYWDTHSVIDDIDVGTVVGVRTGRKSDTLTIRFEPADIQRIRERAAEQGIGPTTLVRIWVREQLRHQEEHPTA